MECGWQKRRKPHPTAACRALFQPECNQMGEKGGVWQHPAIQTCHSTAKSVRISRCTYSNTTQAQNFINLNPFLINPAPSLRRGGPSAACGHGCCCSGCCLCCQPGPLLPLLSATATTRTAASTPLHPREGEDCCLYRGFLHQNNNKLVFPALTECFYEQASNRTL